MSSTPDDCEITLVAGLYVEMSGFWPVLGSWGPYKQGEKNSDQIHFVYTYADGYRTKSSPKSQPLSAHIWPSLTVPIGSIVS